MRPCPSPSQMPGDPTENAATKGLAFVARLPVLRVRRPAALFMGHTLQRSEGHVEAASWARPETAQAVIVQISLSLWGCNQGGSHRAGGLLPPPTARNEKHPQTHEFFFHPVPSWTHCQTIKCQELANPVATFHFVGHQLHPLEEAGQPFNLLRCHLRASIQVLLLQRGHSPEAVLDLKGQPEMLRPAAEKLSPCS